MQINIKGCLRDLAIYKKPAATNLTCNIKAQTWVFTDEFGKFGKTLLNKQMLGYTT